MLRGVGLSPPAISTFPFASSVAVCRWRPVLMDPVEVQAGIESVGRTSFVVIQLLTQGGRAVAFARSVIVCIDGDAPSPIPDAFRAMGSLEFAKMLIQESKVAVSPGIGFGEHGDGHEGQAAERELPRGDRERGRKAKVQHAAIPRGPQKIKQP